MLLIMQRVAVLEGLSGETLFRGLADSAATAAGGLDWTAVKGIYIRLTFSL